MQNDVYSYDANANVVGIVDEQQALTTRSLDSDGLDRLTTGSGVWGSEAFSYDPLDNLRTSTVGARAYTHQINATTQRLEALKATAITVMAYA